MKEVKNPNKKKFCLVVGETGSGKSTQLPQYIFNDMLREGSGKMYCV